MEFDYPTFSEWREALPAGQKKHADLLLSQFKVCGADDPEDDVRSEISEDIPQLARFLFLQTVLKKYVESWRNASVYWARKTKGKQGKQTYSSFPGADEAACRMLAAGISIEDIESVVNAVAYSVAWEFVDTIDNGCNPHAPVGVPGWVLVETDLNGEPTGRVLDGLHEDILSMFEELINA